jgi:predicted HAD superfamily Cof-like phosphohydrolase
MTNYEKVIQFNKEFGVKTFDTPQPTIFDDDPKLVKYRMDLIREEVKELEQGVCNKDLVESVDALADILYVVYGMGVSIGVNMDQAFDLVHKSNMSKLCVSEEDAKKTVEWYINEYKSGNQPYDTPSYRKSEDGKYWVVYNISSGKILKSIYYEPVDLTNLCK